MNTHRRSLPRRAVLAMGWGLVFCTAAAAETSTIFTFKTPANAVTQGNPVAAQAVITVSANDIHVVLTNLLNNPKSIGQALSFLFFQVDGGGMPGTLSSSSAMSRTISSKGSYKDGPVVATGWKFISSGTQMELCDINCGASGPKNTLIGGPGANGKYTSNSSISGNGPHNPFLVGNAVFDLAVTGVTYQSKISNVSFGFGTSNGSNVGAVQYSVATVPEPSAILLLASCIGAIALISRRKWISPPTAR